VSEIQPARIFWLLSNNNGSQPGEKLLGEKVEHISYSKFRAEDKDRRASIQDLIPLPGFRL
jgi:hypothetical protein